MKSRRRSKTRNTRDVSHVLVNQHPDRVLQGHCCQILNLFYTLQSLVDAEEHESWEGEKRGGGKGILSIFCNGGSGLFVRTPTGQVFSYWQKMRKFQSRNLSPPEWSRPHSRDETTEDCHPHRLSRSPSVRNLQYPWPANPLTAERLAASPTKTHCDPTVDPCPLWDSRKWKNRSPGQVWEQTTATPVHLHLPGSQNSAPKQSKTPMENDHWRLQPLYRQKQPSGKTWADHYIQAENRTLQPECAPEANWHHGLCTLWL